MKLLKEFRERNIFGNMNFSGKASEIPVYKGVEMVFIFNVFIERAFETGIMRKSKAVADIVNNYACIIDRNFSGFQNHFQGLTAVIKAMPLYICERVHIGSDTACYKSKPF